ncbi:MAG: type II secretion system F family protein, partial [Candidatus Omnitrophica bacterium]|nr:type II secretion system F family protein [Candidatus Omnitrophota bacterium]
MPRYQYIARDINGQKIEGVLVAPSNLAVITRIRNQNLFPVDIKVIGEKDVLLSGKKEENIKKKGRVNLKELAIFTRQASTMLAAGVSIVETLDDLSSQASNRHLAFILKEIKKEIQEGSNFSSSLSKYPKVFSPLYIALVRTGEESGNLAEVLSEIASNLEDQIIH